MAVGRDDVRRIALALPHAQELPHRRSPSFRVEMRIFCTMPTDADWIVVKLDREDQLNMFEGHPEAVKPARHYSHHGWTYVLIDRLDEPLLRTLLLLAWTHVAPKRLVKAARQAM
jgi:hypothetical protein